MGYFFANSLNNLAALISCFLFFSLVGRKHTIEIIGASSFQTDPEESVFNLWAMTSRIPTPTIFIPNFICSPTLCPLIAACFLDLQRYKT